MVESFRQSLATAQNAFNAAHPEFTSSMAEAVENLRLANFDFQLALAEWDATGTEWRNSPNYSWEHDLEVRTHYRNATYNLRQAERNISLLVENTHLLAGQLQNAQRDFDNAMANLTNAMQAAQVIAEAYRVAFENTITADYNYVAARDAVARALTALNQCRRANR